MQVTLQQHYHIILVCLQQALWLSIRSGLS